MRDAVQLTQEKIELFCTALVRLERSAGTVEQYRRSLKRLRQELPRGKALTKEGLIAWKKEAEKRSAVSTVNCMIAAINTYVAFMGAPQMKLRRVKSQRRITNQLLVRCHVRLLNIPTIPNSTNTSQNSKDCDYDDQLNEGKAVCLFEKLLHTNSSDNTQTVAVSMKTDIAKADLGLVVDGGWYEHAVTYVNGNLRQDIDTQYIIGDSSTQTISGFINPEATVDPSSAGSATVSTDSVTVTGLEGQSITVTIMGEVAQAFKYDSTQKKIVYAGNYTTLEEAVSNAVGGYVVMLADTVENSFSTSYDLCLDLDGNDITILTEDGSSGTMSVKSFCGMDSKTNGFQAGDAGKFSGTISATETSYSPAVGAYAGKHYAAVTVDGKTQFHRVAASFNAYRIDSYQGNLYMTVQGTFRGTTDAVEELTGMGFVFVNDTDLTKHAYTENDVEKNYGVLDTYEKANDSVLVEYKGTLAKSGQYAYINYTFPTAEENTHTVLCRVKLTGGTFDSVAHETLAVDKDTLGDPKPVTKEAQTNG